MTKLHHSYFLFYSNVFSTFCVVCFPLTDVFKNVYVSGQLILVASASILCLHGGCHLLTFQAGDRCDVHAIRASFHSCFDSFTLVFLAVQFVINHLFKLAIPEY